MPGPTFSPFPEEATPEQFDHARAVIERVVATDERAVDTRETLLDQLEGVSAAIGTIVVARSAFPSSEAYDDAHFYADEQQSMYVLRSKLARKSLWGKAYFCALRPTDRGAYMAIYERIGDMTRVRSDVLLPNELDTERLRNYEANTYETDGQAAHARESRLLSSLRVAIPGAADSQPNEPQVYFRVLKKLSKRLLAAAE